jgi:glycosyltransferase involved in cell wall biosynthesis
MTRIRVLLVHNAYIHRGGEDVCVDQEMNALTDLGYEVEMFRVQSEPGRQGILQALQAPAGQGLEKDLEDRLDQFKPNILHAHNLYPLFSARIFGAAKKRGIKTVQTLHNFRPLCLNGLFLTPQKEICERCAPGNYLHGVLRGCYRGRRVHSAGLAAHLTIARQAAWYDAVDQFIAPSEFLRRRYMAYGFAAQRIETQGHGWFEKSEQPAAPEPYILYLGRLSEEKGVRWLLEVFGKPRLGLRLVVAGDGPLEDAVRKAASASVDIKGFVTGETKRDLIRRASAVVLASECYENFPMVIPEANAAGVPVLAADLGGMAEQIEPGINGERFAPRDVDAFWQAAARVGSSGPNASSYNRHAVQHFAQDRFGPTRFKERRQRLYERLLSS